MYAYEPVGGGAGDAQTAAEAVLTRIVKLLKRPCTPPIQAERVLEIDNDLRPEGRCSGAKVRCGGVPTRVLRAMGRDLGVRPSPAPGSWPVPEEVARAFFRVVDRHRYPAVHGPPARGHPPA
ncbi:hypothetical protein QJS66_01330 [Kocuria rhizophila]|nr:hypothetical protein QJS66_01330 [Kocuria rhizophila]